MHRQTASDFSEDSQSIYPMTRQELSMPAVSWTRLRAAEPQNQTTEAKSNSAQTSPNKTIKSVAALKFANKPFAAGVNQNATVDLPATTPLANRQSTQSSQPTLQSHTVLQRNSTQNSQSVGDEVSRINPDRHSILDRLQNKSATVDAAANTKQESLQPKTDPSKASNRPAESSDTKVDSKNAADVEVSTPKIGEATEKVAVEKHSAEKDAAEKKVPKPKFLKHAVRFGNPASSQQKKSAQATTSGDPTTATESQPGETEKNLIAQQQIVSQFQKKNLPGNLQKSHLRNLRGVDSRGQVYGATNPAAAIPTNEVDSALSCFFEDGLPTVGRMPIINVTPNSTQRSSKQTASVPAADSHAAVQDSTDSVTPYWMSAAIQIILGTMVIIYLMNMTQWLLSSSPPQTLQSPPPSMQYPVQQATGELPEASSPVGSSESDLTMVPTDQSWQPLYRPPSMRR